MSESHRLHEFRAFGERMNARGSIAIPHLRRAVDTLDEVLESTS